MKIVHLLPVLLLLAAPGRLCANNPKVDSLLHLLETHATIDRAEVLWGIAYELFDLDNPQALFYAERAYREVWKGGDSLQIVKIGTTYGQLLRRVGKVDLSIEVSSRLLPIAKRHDYRKYTKMLLNSLGAAFIFKEIFEKALEYNYESLTMREEDGDSIEIGIALQNIGLIHYKLNDYELAINYISKAIELSNMKVGAKFNLLYLNLGASYVELGKYDLANSYLKTAIAHDQQSGDIGSTASIYQCYARSLFLSGELDSAENYAHISNSYAKKMSDKWSMTMNYILLSKIALARNQLAESDRFISLADSVSLNCDYPYLRLEVLRQRARHLARSGESALALKMLEDHEKLRDSLFHGDKDPRIRKIQVAFAQRENEMKLSTQASILALRNEALERHRAFIYVVSGLLVIVVVLALELFRANRKKQLVNRFLDEKVAERTAELRLQGEVLQRTVTEQEIHEGKVASHLLSNLGTLKGLVQLGRLDDPCNAAQYFSKAEAVAAEMTEVVRKLLRGGAK